MIMFLEFASIEFSINSLTTDAGLSTTSPAAILFAVSSFNIFILFKMSFPPFNAYGRKMQMRKSLPNKPS